MKRNKAIACFFLSMLLLSLVACGGVADTEQSEIIKPGARQSSVSDKSVTITLLYPSQAITVDGYYTGSAVNGVPSGYGTFRYWDNNETYSLDYEGEFVNGAFSGSGKMTEKDTANDLLRVYEGQFRNGVYNGKGTLTVTTISNNSSYQLTGTFTEGEYTPTASEAFGVLGNMGIFGPFQVSQEQAAFIDGHNELFPTCERATAEAADLVNFAYREFTKMRKQEEIGLVKLRLTAIQVFEDDFIDGKVTYLLARDSEGQTYTVYYQNHAEIYDGDAFTVYALPCAITSFDNIGGGTTSVIVLLACHMQ